MNLAVAVVVLLSLMEPTQTLPIEVSEISNATQEYPEEEIASEVRRVVLRDSEEVTCDALPGNEGLLRNGIGDNSYFIWPGRQIPYFVDPTFDSKGQANINEAISNFNQVFKDCIQWVPRWTTAYGEKYDYDSIMHYSANAFSKHNNPFLLTIVPKKGEVSELGRRLNYSDTDIHKVQKMYKCGEYADWANDCSSDSDCGFNEFCDSYIVNGQCRTKLPDGSLCYQSDHCINRCYTGVCTSCQIDEDCQVGQYCAYKYVPFWEKSCSEYCQTYCFTNSQCGGECNRCGWDF
ncbi:hypothetical protein TCAL_16325, partial [Tigriopus californicus]